MASVYEAESVVGFLRSRLLDPGAARGAQSALAEACGCQGSYLSQALRERVQLTPDHVLGAARHWHLDDEETDFLLLLLQRDRAATTALKAHATLRIKGIRERQRALVERLRVKDVARPQGQADAAYYADWLNGAVHVATSIEALRRPPELAARLGVSAETLDTALSLLVSLDLLEREGLGPRARYLPTRRNLHLPQDSPFCAVNHRNHRLLALERLRAPEPQSLHYTAMHSLSRADIPRLREALVRAVEETRRIVDPSPEEEIVCVLVDFFRL